MTDRSAIDEQVSIFVDNAGFHGKKIG